MPSVHGLCTELWSLRNVSEQGDSVGGRLERRMCHPKRQLYCVFSKMGHRGVVRRRLCKGQVPSCLNRHFLQIISKEWGREGNLAVRIMLQLSLFRMHTVAFL